MTARVVQCDSCGEHAIFDAFPAESSDEALDRLMFEESWRVDGEGRETCPDCSGGSDD